MKKNSNYIKATRKILYNYSYLVTELKLKQQELEYIKCNDGMTGITYELTPPSVTNAITSKVENVGDRNIESEQQLLGEIRRLQMNMQKIEHVLEILNDTEREIIRLRYTEDKPWGYIADTLDYSEKHCQSINAKIRMYRNTNITMYNIRGLFYSFTG